MAKDKAGFDLFIAVLGKTFNLFHVIFSLFSKYEIIIMVILVRLSTDF